MLPDIASCPPLDHRLRLATPLAGDRSLRGLAALERLRPGRLAALETRLVPREHRRHDVIFHPDDPARGLYVILSGVVRLSLPVPNGRRVLLHLLPAGEIFGHTALVGNGTPRHFEATAYTDVRLGFVTTDAFLEAVAGPQAALVSEVVSLVTERWIALVLRLARFLGQDLRARVASALVEAARGFGVEDARGHVLALRITQEAIADLAAGSVRKVNGMLRRFEQAGLMGKADGRIVLRRLDALEDIALGG